MPKLSAKTKAKVNKQKVKFGSIIAPRPKNGHQVLLRDVYVESIEKNAISQLKVWASKLGITGFSKLKKSELVALIRSRTNRNKVFEHIYHVNLSL
jgi:hypothetical protein